MCVLIIAQKCGLIDCDSCQWDWMQLHDIGDDNLRIIDAERERVARDRGRGNVCGWFCAGLRPGVVSLHCSSSTHIAMLSRNAHANNDLLNCCCEHKWGQTQSRSQQTAKTITHIHMAVTPLWSNVSFVVCTDENQMDESTQRPAINMYEWSSQGNWTSNIVEHACRTSDLIWNAENVVQCKNWRCRVFARNRDQLWPQHLIWHIHLGQPSTVKQQQKTRQPTSLCNVKTAR